MNNKYLILLSLMLILGLNCSNKQKLTLTDYELSKSTIQLIKVNDSLFVRVVPDDGENGSKIQMFNKFLEVVDEVPCMDPLPVLQLEQDTLHLVFYLGSSSMNYSKNNLDYYRKKYQKLADLKLNYESVFSKGSQIVSTNNIDSVSINKQQIKFYCTQKLIDSTVTDRLFFSVENNSYYLWELVDSLEINRELIPTGNLNTTGVFNKFIR